MERESKISKKEKKSDKVENLSRLHPETFGEVSSASSRMTL